MNIDVAKLLVFTGLVGGFCYLVGLSFLTFVRTKLAAIHHLVSPVLGLALLGLQLWGYGLAGIPWSRLSVVAPWIVVLLLGRKKVWRSLPRPKVLRATWRSFTAMDMFSKVLVVLSIIFSLAFIVSLTVQPIVTSDVLAIWGYKAKDFFFHHQVFVNPYLYETVNSARFYHVDYPPLLPLMADVFYVLLGHINEGLFKLLQALFLFSGATALFVYIKNGATKNRDVLQIAAIATFILIAVPQFVPMLFKIQYMGYADFPLSIFILISGLFLARYITTDSAHDWWLSLGFASFAGVTKNEGIAFLGIMLVLLFGLRLWPLVTNRSRQNYKTIAYLLVGGLLVLLPTFLWTMYKQKHGLVVDFKFSNLRNSGMSAGARLHLIIRYIRLYVSTNPAFHWETAALVLASVATLIKRTRLTLILAGVIWAQLGSYVLSYVFSPYDLKFHVLSSIDRLLTQVLPLVILLLAINLLVYSRKQSA